MKFLPILSLFLLFFGGAALASENCLPIDWMYNLNIGSLKIDKEKLADFCTEKTCTIDAGFITIRSHFNANFAVIVKDSEITVRAPYNLNELGLIISPSGLDEFDWQASVKIDLAFLKHNGLLKIEDSDIEKIANSAKRGENIFYCQGEWKQFVPKCSCRNDEVTCFECEGALPLTVSLPEEILPYDLAVGAPASEETVSGQEEPVSAVEQEEKRPLYYYFTIFLFLIIVISTAVIYAKSKKTPPKEVEVSKEVPCHLGIIMDGNRRWAKDRGLPDFEGHKMGVERTRQVAKYCRERGIKVLTLYAFSTENWNRSEKEVNFLMELLTLYLTKEMKELQKDRVGLRVIGQRERLPVSLQKKIEEAEKLTRANDGLILVLAISYGGRDEIIRAVTKSFLFNGVNPDELTEEKLGDCLDTAGLPDPDLIIRTSGEQRTSGFLLWQSAYSELYFTEKYWPDFSEEDLDEALAEYDRRQRRFGK